MKTTDNLSDRILIIDPDLHFIDLTLELAAKGEGQVKPNPMVGALVVKDGVGDVDRHGGFLCAATLPIAVVKSSI